MAYKKIKSVDIVSLGTFSGVFYALIGLLYGLLLAFFSSLLTPFIRQLSENGDIPNLGLFGAVGIVLFPIIFFVIGFVAGIIGALLINLGLLITRGLKIDIED